MLDKHYDYMNNEIQRPKILFSTLWKTLMLRYEVLVMYREMQVVGNHSQVWKLDIGTYLPRHQNYNQGMQVATFLFQSMQGRQWHMITLHSS